MAVKELDTPPSKLVLILVFQVLISHFIAANATGKDLNFGRAKTILRKNIYGPKGLTFYCNCEYQKKRIKKQSCKLKTKKFKKRQGRLEWEHVVPAHAFGKSFKEWREHKQVCPKQKSPRKCAQKKNPLFAQMEGNLFNLVPAVGAINALRRNYSFTQLKDLKNEICAGGMMLNKRKVSPPIGRRGDIARIYMYMNKKYPGRGIISKKNQKLFEAWDKIDPVDRRECELNRLKGIYQKDQNQFVIKNCKGKK